MFDAFPYDEWGEDIAGFWTFGPGSSTGTYILTALGIAVMLIAFVWFVRLENRSSRTSRQRFGRPARSIDPSTGAPRRRRWPASRSTSRRCRRRTRASRRSCSCSRSLCIVIVAIILATDVVDGPWLGPW